MKNKKRLIDANALIDGMKKRCNSLIKEYGSLDHYADGFAEAINYVENAPTVEVVHGRWLRGDEMPDYPRVPYISDKHYCSECRNEAHEEYDGRDYSEILSAYCPNCGADMRGTKNG